MPRTIALLLTTLCTLGISIPTRADDKVPSKLETRKIKFPHTVATYEFIHIPAGTVLVPGATKDDPSTKVQVKSIWVGKTEVTWDVFDVWAYALDLPDAQRAKAIDKLTGSRPTNPYAPPDRGFGHQGYPAISMAYEGTLDYCKWLTEKTGVPMRLPTEAEWIYACRAGADKDPDRSELPKLAWFQDNSDKKTHPVATKQPNPWGLYDMFGNVGEFVQMLPNGDKAIKGGSFKDKIAFINSTRRDVWNDDWQALDPDLPKSKWWMSDADFAGFRLVCDQDPAKAKQ